MIAAIFNSLDILLFRSVIRYPADNCQRARNVLDFWRWFKFVTVALLIFHYFIALDRRRSQPIARIAHGSIPAIALDCTRSQSCSHIIAEDFDFTPAIDQAFKAEKHKHRLLNVILYWILFELSSLSLDRRESQILFRKFPCHNWYFLPVHIAAKIIKVRCLLGSNSVSGLEENLLGEKMVKLDKRTCLKVCH